MRIRFSEAGDIRTALEDELASLPQDRPIEIDTESIDIQTLRKSILSEADGTLFVSDDLSPAVFGYMMFALSLRGFSLEDAEVLTPRQSVELPVEYLMMLSGDDMDDFDMDVWSDSV